MLFDELLKRVLMVAVRVRNKPRGDDDIILVDRKLANSLVHKVGAAIVSASAVVNEKSSVGEAVDISLTAVHKRRLTDRAKQGLADLGQVAAILVAIFRERAVYSSDRARVCGVVGVDILLVTLEGGVYVACERALEELLISARFKLLAVRAKLLKCAICRVNHLGSESAIYYLNISLVVIHSRHSFFSCGFI